LPCLQIRMTRERHHDQKCVCLRISAYVKTRTGPRSTLLCRSAVHRVKATPCIEPAARFGSNGETSGTSAETRACNAQPPCSVRAKRQADSSARQTVQTAMARSFSQRRRTVHQIDQARGRMVNCRALASLARTATLPAVPKSFQSKHRIRRFPVRFNTSLENRVSK
jgi:hypothetical protein